MIKIALVALLAAAAVSQPLGEPIVQEKVTHSKPVFTEEYGPAEVINEDQAHQMIKQYMSQANQQDQFNKLNWQTSGSSNSGGAAVLGADWAAAPAAVAAPAVSAPAIQSQTYTLSAPALSGAQFSSGSNFYLARPGGYRWLGNNGAATLQALAAPKTYTTSSTSFVNSAPSHGAYASHYRTEAPALTQSFQYVNAAPAITSTNFNTEAAPAVSSYNYASPAVDVAPAAPAFQTSSFNYQAAAPAIQYNAAPIQHSNAIFAANDSPMNEIVQEKDLGLGASDHIEQVKAPVTAESFTFGSKQSANRVGTKF